MPLTFACVFYTLMVFGKGAVMSELLSACAAVVDRDGFCLPAEVQLAEVEEILTARAMLDAALARRLRAVISSDATTEVCAQTTKGWLVDRMHLSPAEARRRVAAAYTHATLASADAAAAAGEITAEHVTQIGTCVRALPAGWRELAEQVLVDTARATDPASLDRVVRELRLRSGADESREAAEQRRYAGRYLKTEATFDGMIRLDGMLDPLAGTTLLTALAPLTGTAGPDDDRSSWQRNADALTDLARHALDSDQLPDHNGTRPQVTVTIDWDTLRGQLTSRDNQTDPWQTPTMADLTGLDDPTPAGTGQLSGSDVPLTAATIRRLACDARIIPAILATNSEPLDIGRGARTWTTGQRRTAQLRDGGCVVTGCTSPTSHTDLHHLHHWANGGKTDIDNAATLCRYHHWLIHHTPWDLQRSPTGQWITTRT
jgi:hypothetical protein